MRWSHLFPARKETAVEGMGRALNRPKKITVSGSSKRSIMIQLKRQNKYIGPLAANTWAQNLRCVVRFATRSSYTEIGDGARAWLNRVAGRPSSMGCGDGSQQ